MKNILVSLMLIGLIGFNAKVNAIENIYSLDDVAPVQNEEVQVTNVNAPLEATVSFDWLDIDLAQRENQIQHYKDLLFTNNSSHIYFTKDEFKKEFSKYYKDKDFKLHYMLTNNGVTEDEDAKYCAFFYKKKTLVLYAIQYKNTPNKAFYYTAFGGLRYTDLMSDEYPNFPYTSMQYDQKGQLKSAIYFASKDLQYMFGPDKEFQGIWYKDKMYDKNGKQVLTRTNW